MNVADRLRASAQRLPDKPALIFQDQQLTYGELDERVDHAAGAFQGLGLQPGDRVALIVGNSPAFVEAFYGALRAGLVVVPINITLTPDEVAHILTDAEARAIVVDEPYARVLDGVREVLPALRAVVLTGASAPGAGTRTWRQFLGAGQDAQPVAVTREDLALLPYTSGTTGRPKGAMLTHGNLLANQQQMAQTRLRVEEQDVILCVLPLFHIYALNVGMAFTFDRGATMLLVERFDPVHTLDEISEHRASVLIGAPPMYVAWVNTPGVEDYDLRSVRYAVSGAAPLPPRVLHRFEQQLAIPIWEGYGLTETSPVLTTNAMGERPVPASIGKPVPGVELRLADERGDHVRRGDPGEIIVRGPNVFQGYWQDEEATKAALDDDGWFHTGDIAYADDDGYLYLVDRKKDLILVSGFNVYPREVEEVLARHPKVAEVAVVGTPHPYTGEAVKAVVVLAEGEQATADEIIAFAQRSLARFKVPEVVDFVATLPHLPSGKVKRRELRGR